MVLFCTFTVLLQHSDLTSPISKYEIVRHIDKVMFAEYKTDWFNKINADQCLSV